MLENFDDNLAEYCYVCAEVDNNAALLGLMASSKPNWGGLEIVSLEVLSMSDSDRTDPPDGALEVELPQLECPNCQDQFKGEDEL